MPLQHESHKGLGDQLNNYLLIERKQFEGMNRNSNAKEHEGNQVNS